MKKRILITATALLTALLITALPACNQNEFAESDGTESFTISESELDSDTSTEGEDESESDTAQTCEHSYAASSEGHWKPECEICGKPAGNLQAHDMLEYVEDEGDLLLYFGSCKICNYVAYSHEIDYSIRAYIGVSAILGAGNSGFSSTEYVYDNGMAYARFTSSGKSSAYACVFEREGEDKTTGEYLVMKIRLGGNRSELTFTLSTFESVKKDQAGVGESRGAAEFKLRSLPSGWCTVIVNLKSAINADGIGYVSNDAGEYYLKQLKLYPGDAIKFPEGDNMDVSYMILCNTLEEAKALVANEPGYYFFEDVSSDGGPSSSGTVCAHTYTYDETSHKLQDCPACGEKSVSEEHTVTEVRDGNKYTYRCVCGYTVKVKEISTGVNLFVSPALIDHEADGHKAFSQSEIIYSEDGDTFVRIWGRKTTSDGKTVTDEVKWYNPLKDNAIVTGQYMAIKVRIGDNGLGQTILKLYTSTKNKDATDERDGLVLPIAEDGEWHVIVVDLAKCVGSSSGSTFVESGGAYTAKFLQIRPFTGFVANEDDYTDIAYIAFDDDLESLVSVIDDEMYYFMSDKGSGAYIKTDGSCITHGFEESFKNSTYTYSCPSCKEVLGSKTVSASINKFYGVNDVSDLLIDTYMVQSRSKLYDDAEEIAYTRFVASGEVMQPAYSRNDREGEANPVSVGGAEYLVITMRMSGVSSLALALGTSKDGNHTNNGANIPVTSFTVGEWVTVVINIRSVYGENTWIKEANGSYTLSHFELTCYHEEGGYLDIASYAFCDSWEEICAISEHETVEYMTSNNVSDTVSHTGPV